MPARIPASVSSRVVNGTAAGGGYELALATDHIILVDDGAAAVALPEVPLLAVLPGTGGLTRVVDKRKVRRDHADFFCTIEEGIKGKRAVAVAPGRRDRAEQQAGGKGRRARAGNSPPRSNAPATARASRLTPLERAVSTTTASATASSASISIARQRIATISIKAPEAPPPADIDGMIAQGAVVLAAAGRARARRRHPASAHQRARDRDAGVQDRMAIRANVLGL